MDSSILKTARRTLRQLRGRVNFNSVSRLLCSYGYIVLEYDTEKPHTFLAEKKLEDYASEKRGFTYRDDEIKIAFIKKSLSHEDKLYTLLHEAGHIILGHIDNLNSLNPRLREMEAEAFAYQLAAGRRF